MVKKILFALLTLLIVSCSSSKPVYKKRYPSKKTTYKKSKSRKPAKRNGIADKIVNTAFTYKGTRYKYGGTTKKGIDCSGLIMNSFVKNGRSLPRTSYDMSNKGKTISLKSVRKGDLLFFTTNPRKPRRVSHVGLVTEVKNGIIYFIHASSKRGVTVNNMSQSYYKKNYAKAKRVL